MSAPHLLSSPHPFRTAVESRDLDAVMASMDDEVRLHSPIAFRPFSGHDQVRQVLAHVLDVLEDFHYVEELAAPASHALVFRAHIGQTQVHGLDLLTLDDEGQVTDLTVMVRPLSAAIALAEAMAPRVGHLAKASAAGQ